MTLKSTDPFVTNIFQTKRSKLYKLRCSAPFSEGVIWGLLVCWNSTRVTRSKDIHDNQDCPETNGAPRDETEVEVRALAHPVRNHRASGAARRVYWAGARAARTEDGRGALGTRIQRLRMRFGRHQPRRDDRAYDRRASRAGSRGNNLRWATCRWAPWRCRKSFPCSKARWCRSRTSPRWCTKGNSKALWQRISSGSTSSSVRNSQWCTGRR